MIIRPSIVVLGLAAVLATALAPTGVVRAQPGGTPPDAAPPPDDPPPDGAPVDPDDPFKNPTPTPTPATPETPIPPYVGEPGAPVLPKRRGRKIPDLPQILTAPTGRLLPAAYIYSRSSVDTSAGLASELRVGLGDVAEFGVATTDLIRVRRSNTGDPERIAPYITASFRVGIAEDKLFHHQPAVALGFRKSFERKAFESTSRIAELNLMASKRIGDKVVVHFGGVFWDASLVDNTGTETLFHDFGWKKQLRPLGGLEFRPLPDAEILVDVSWAPSFCYRDCTEGPKIRLDPILSWGVRYLVADWLHLESGVRVPDIRDVNLLDAQIFGQVTFISTRLRKIVDRLGGEPEPGADADD